MKPPIYMDYHATTPVDRRVLEAMLPYFSDTFGNSASRSHIFGWEAEAAVDEARQRIADTLSCTPKEVVFTSGATESNNLAIFGVARLFRDEGSHIVAGTTEHKSVLDSCKELQREGLQVTYLAPDNVGRISADRVREAITDRTILVSLMLANNEIGTIQPIRQIGAVCKEKGVLFHTDAVQGFGKIPFDVGEFGVDLASVTAHKIYGPKGVGALYVRAKNPRVRLKPLVYGGGHERGWRSGTLNVPGIVGFGKAVEIYASERELEAKKLRLLRQRLYRALVAALDEIQLNGPPLPEIGDDGALRDSEEGRLPGNLNVAFGCVEGEALIMGMKDIAVSSGSACTSASIEPSHVLKAIGLPDELAHASVRFGLGRFNTEEEIDYTIGVVVNAVKRLRELSPRYAKAKSD